MSTDNELDPTLSFTQEDWQEEGYCRGADQRLWFPQRGESAEHAKKICRVCPVAERCLEYALEIGTKHGIWGGKSERERRALRREI